MSQTFHSVFNWHKCVLCQRETREALRYPGNTIADANATTSHETLSRIIPQFRDLEMKLTLRATIIELVDGGTLKETFKSRNAKWHKSCYGKFTITNLRQAEKRKTCDIIPSMGKLTQMFNRINQEFQERWQDRVVMPLPIGKVLWGRESLYFDVRSESKEVCAADTGWETASKVVCGGYDCTGSTLSLPLPCYTVQQGRSGKKQYSNRSMSKRRIREHSRRNSGWSNIVYCES